MDKNFFNHKFQKRTWAFPNTIEYKTDECFTNFQDYFYNYKNRSLKTFNSNNIFNYISWNLKEIDNLKIKISLDIENTKLIKNKKTAISLYTTQGITKRFENDPNLIIEPKELVITEKTLLNQDFSVSFSKFFETQRQELRISSVPLLPNTTTTNRYISNEFFEKDPEFGWDAVDFVKINEKTVKMFFTAEQYRANIDFHNLVVDIHFSESVEPIGHF